MRERNFSKMLNKQKTKDFVITDKICGSAADVKFEIGRLIDQFKLMKSFLQWYYRGMMTKLDAESEKEEAESARQYRENMLRYADELEVLAYNPCINCDFGNGEGGCTIPDCDNDFYEHQSNQNREKYLRLAAEIRTKYLADNG